MSLHYQMYKHALCQQQLELENKDAVFKGLFAELEREHKGNKVELTVISFEPLISSPA
ncbi:uncharacterized protein LOC112198980 [Rosa chinensis]|uniref:uncharacterized protein LOC112198980 n=1 Tax=Rosa chinensis TaxID=74649 RepID=UPI000D093DDA|nr:uncharacterized protein LOC112198980 [Rosa chinensis]